MEKQRVSSQYSLSGDLDGLSIREAIDLFEYFASQFGEDAVIDVQTEKVYGYGGWTDEDAEFFVVKEKM